MKSECMCSGKQEFCFLHSAPWHCGILIWVFSNQDAVDHTLEVGWWSMQILQASCVCAGNELLGVVLMPECGLWLETNLTSLMFLTFPATLARDLPIFCDHLPLWAVVKQRMQMYHSPYKTVLQCVRTVRSTEGLGAFYRSYTTQLTMNIPFQAIHFITYEFMQEQINPRRQYNPQTHIVSGAVAGAVAAAATTPLDVCKTLLNTQENMALSSVNISGHLSGMANAFRTVYQLGGVAGYFKGVQARVIYQMPSTAIAWSVYEFFKYFLTKREANKKTPRW